jgi:hypothetical protein
MLSFEVRLSLRVKKYFVSHGVLKPRVGALRVMRIPFIKGVELVVEEWLNICCLGPGDVQLMSSEYLNSN